MIGPAPSLYRRQVGERTPSPVLAVGGYVIGYTGVTVLLTGLLVASFQAGFGSNENNHAGRNIALVGAAMTVGGGLMFYYGWPTE